MNGERALVVMARYPEPGAVKTRLAATHGDIAATELHRACIADLDARFGSGPRRLVWAYYPPDRAFADIVRAPAYCMAQEGTDLGARMHACFRRLVDAGFVSVVMIGADVPHVRTAWIDEAEARLNDVDVVLGPSVDGGYFLVAMRQPHDVFSDVMMSTPHVLSDTQRVIAAAGLCVHLLPPSFDVDQAADLDRLRTELQAPELAGKLPATAAWLSAQNIR